MWLEGVENYEGHHGQHQAYDHDRTEKLVQPRSRPQHDVEFTVSRELAEGEIDRKKERHGQGEAKIVGHQISQQLGNHTNRALGSQHKVQDP